jgi:hypothetical protein
MSVPQQRHSKKAFRTPLTAPEGSIRTGDTLNYGGEDRLIYRRPKPYHLRSQLVPLKDDDGRIVRKTNQAGKEIDTPRTQRVATLDENHPDYWDTFILDDSGNGVVELIPVDLKAMEAEKERRAAERAREKKLQQILDAFSRSNVSPDELVAELEARKRSAKAPQAAQEPDDDAGEGESALPAPAAPQRAPAKRRGRPPKKTE